MSDVLDQALIYLLGSEGQVYTNHPSDSGGPTKYGVTLKAYASFLGREVLPEEIQALTLEQIKAFYEARYWKPLLCTRISSAPISIGLFDSGVLYGVGTAALLAQKALCWCGAQLKLDGHIGDKSIEAFNLVKPEEFLPAFRLFILQRIDAVIKLDPKNEVFREGWINRANRLLTLSTGGLLIKEVT